MEFRPCFSFSNISCSPIHGKRPFSFTKQELLWESYRDTKHAVHMMPSAQLTTSSARNASAFPKCQERFIFRFSCLQQNRRLTNDKVYTKKLQSCCKTGGILWKEGPQLLARERWRTGQQHTLSLFRIGQDKKDARHKTAHVAEDGSNWWRFVFWCISCCFLVGYVCTFPLFTPGILPNLWHFWIWNLKKNLSLFEDWTWQLDDPCVGLREAPCTLVRMAESIDAPQKPFLRVRKSHTSSPRFFWGCTKHLHQPWLFESIWIRLFVFFGLTMRGRQVATSGSVMCESCVRVHNTAQGKITRPVSNSMTFVSFGQPRGRILSPNSAFASTGRGQFVFESVVLELVNNKIWRERFPLGVPDLVVLPQWPKTVLSRTDRKFVLPRLPLVLGKISDKKLQETNSVAKNTAEFILCSDSTTPVVRIKTGEQFTHIHTFQSVFWKLLQWCCKNCCKYAHCMHSTHMFCRFHQ